MKGVRHSRTAIQRVLASARDPWLVVGAGCIVAFLAAVAPLVRGSMAPIFDADGFFVPYYTLVADFARHGRLLFWNPWTNAGSPDHIEPQIGALSPLVVLSGFLTGGGEPGYRIHWLTVWAGSMIGLLALARRLRVPPVAGGAIALAFALSGPWLGNAQHFSFLFSFAFLPFVLLRVDVALTDSRRLPAMQAGALWGLSALGGYPGVVFASGMFTLLWIVGRVALRPAHSRHLRAAVSMVGVFGLAALPVMTAAVAPMLLEGPGYTARSGALLREVASGSNALQPRGLLTIFSPYLATLSPRRLWPATDISSVSVYLGAVPLFLALYALVAQPLSRLRWLLLATATFFMALAVGDALPLRGWLYDLVPPSRYFRHASLFRFQGVFALSILAFLGARDLLGDSVVRWKRLSGVSLAMGLAVAAVIVCRRLETIAGSLPATRGMGTRHLYIVWLGVVLLSIAAAFARYRFRHTVTATILVVLSIYDARQSFTLSQTVGSRSLAPTWRALEKNRKTGLDLLEETTRPRLAFSNDSTGLGPGPTDKNLLLRRSAFFAYAPLTTYLHELWARSTTLARFVSGPERTYFAEAVAHAPPTMDAFQAFSAHVERTGQMPIVVHDRREMSQIALKGVGMSTAELAAVPPARSIPVHWTEYRPGSVAIDVDAPAAGWLLFSDRWTRGWQATIDGVSVPVRGGNFLFRALPVAAGHRQIKMIYKPTGQPWILLLCWATLLALLVASVADRFRRRRDTGLRRVELP